MKIQFSSRSIADNCTTIAYILIVVMCFLGILAVADVIFRWDILGGIAEELAYLFMSSCVVIILSCFLVSLMVNMNIMSKSMENIAHKLNSREDEA
ncbi:MAG: hypothetical protein AB8F78_17720 [Saprospiraceae bacterium]